MDHSEARALLELAAAEPDGFERLAAGDTPEAAALAGHLAGCPDCAADVEALGRASATLRAAIRELPRPELRARTLAFVAATGRPRGAAATAAAGAAEASAPGLAAEGTPATALPGQPIATPVERPASRWAWPAIAAAAMLVAAIGLAGWWTTREALEDERHASAGLAAVTEAAFRVQAQPDAQLVALAGTSGTGQERGELSFSVASSELVVVAEGLAEPPDGMEYRCWVEVDDVRARVGTMYQGGGLSYWAGRSEKVAELAPGAKFGVSLGPKDGAANGEAVLVGEL
jgi:hypothetical protein